MIMCIVWAQMRIAAQCDVREKEKKKEVEKEEEEDEEEEDEDEDEEGLKYDCAHSLGRDAHNCAAYGRSRRSRTMRRRKWRRRMRESSRRIRT